MGDSLHNKLKEEDLELIQDFLQESEEHLNNVEAALLTIEENPGDKEALHSAFRAFHTIKGISGFLGLTDIQTLTHNAETILDKARSEKLKLDSSLIDLILEAQDALKGLIGDVARYVNNEPPEFDSRVLLPLVEKLKSAAEGKTESSGRTEETPETGNQEPNPQATEKTEEKKEQGAGNDPRQPQASKSRHATTTSFLKVDTRKLDMLVELVGELVITQSQIAANKVLTEHPDDRLLKDLDQLEKILKDVQDLSLSLRMIPIKGLFQKMNRVVRDLARSLGKDVKMILSGEDTELDKTVIEQMHDPLVHMIRNSVDHGIEPPEERIKSGKPAQGTVFLSACHRAGHIIIEIKDDGRGLDKKAILQKAIAQGLVTPEQQLSDNEIYQLIFKPGFSTAKNVTNVSGRGVGMDVVHRNIKALRGRIEIESKEGKGTTFMIKLPLTLAIIEGMLIKIHEEQYIIPIAAVKESLMIDKKSISTVAGKGQMVQIRGNFIPLMHLEETMGKGIPKKEGEKFLLVVVEHEDKVAAFRVDDIIGQQQVVIKSIGEVFSNLPGIAGCAILGDGRVCMILDVAALVSMIQ